MYTDETQILIMLFSKPKKKWKNIVLQKNAFEVYELQKHDTVRNVRYSATFYQKKGESGGKKREENPIFYTTTASRWFDCRNRFLVLNIISVISNEKEGLTLASQPPQSLPKIQEYWPTRVWQFGQYNLPERFCRISGSIHFTGLINTEAANKKIGSLD